MTLFTNSLPLKSEFGVKICRLSFFFLIFGTPRVGSGEIGCSGGSFVEPDVSHFLHVLSQLSPPLTQPLYTPCLVYNSANKYFRITLILANAKKFTILLFDLYKFPAEVFYDYYYYNYIPQFSNHTALNENKQHFFQNPVIGKTIFQNLQLLRLLQ